MDTLNKYIEIISRQMFSVPDGQAMKFKFVFNSVERYKQGCDDIVKAIEFLRNRTYIYELNLLECETFTTYGIIVSIKNKKGA